MTHRKLLQSKAIAIENDLRGTLRNFGLTVGVVGKVKFEARIKELVENLPDLAVLVEPLLVVRRVLSEQIVILHRRLLAIVRDDEVCRRLRSERWGNRPSGLWSMDHFAGLDVSVKETSVCIVDDTGKLVREVKVSSEPEALLAVPKTPAYHFKRIGLEAGPLSQWLYSAFAEAELPVVCV
jgi:transposase